MADDRREESPLRNEVTPGERLRQARESESLDIKSLAAELNVDDWMLEALEADDYSRLGAPVFAKGHMRKYAKRLGVDPDELMVAYYQFEGTREAPPLINESILRVENARAPAVPWLLPAVGVLAAVAVLGAAVLWLIRDSSEVVTESVASPEPPPVVIQGSRTLTLPLGNEGESGPTEAPAGLPTTPAPVEASPPDAPPSGSVATSAANIPEREAPEPVAESPEPVGPPPAAEPVAEPAPVSSAGGTVTLTLRFTEESWVEVYDADRRKLLYGLGEGGSTRYLSGRPPLSVFLGRFSGVEVEVEGQPFSIPRSSRRGNTARFRVAN